jgi:hypothetical protein
MVTKSLAKGRASSDVGKPDCRCSICGKKMTSPQEMLTIDNTLYCDTCYHECFFANTSSSHRLTLDRCDG